MSETILKEEEKIIFALRSLYRKYGYLPYKTSKFEEYDLYVANKEFLMGDGVITFNDTDGRLLALKPDVTLSIIKNGGDGEGTRKVFYNENVYRISAKTERFKETMQVGLECIGDIGLYDVYETVMLAAGSLHTISPRFALDISHIGVLSAILDGIRKGEEFASKILQCIAGKNRHETLALCAEYGVSEKDTQKLETLVSAYGSPAKVLLSLKAVCDGEEQKALQDLEKLCTLLSATEYADNIRLDFSVINDRNYYDNIVFKGFIDGIGEGVLSGGRYDKLLKRMGRTSGGIGFAVNIDALEGFGLTARETDAEVLILYDDATPTERLIEKANALIKAGKTVAVCKQAGKLRYKELLDMSGGVQ